MRYVLVIFIGVIFISSCTVTNNLYVNDPVSVEKNKANFYIGIGTGTEAKIDSVTIDNNVVFSDKVGMAPNLCFGGQIGLLHNFDLRFSVHLPYIVGGFGFSVGPQYSFFNNHSKVNMAIGSDLGFVFAKDSLTLFGSTSALDIYSNGAMNADFFMPISFSFSEKSRIIITPRYSYNVINMRYNTGENDSYKFNLYVPSIAVGLKLNKLYLEASVFQFENKYYPNFGLVYILESKSNKK